MAKHSTKHHMLQAAAFLLFCFLILSMYIVYLQVVVADGLKRNGLNRRTTFSETSVLRGTILDAEGRALAQSTLHGSRSYPMGEALSAVTGYYDEAVGCAGIESYANRSLLGITEEMENMGPVTQLFLADRGNDVLLTIDADAQQAAYDGLAGRRGAAVVLDAETGAVIALVSSPSFDPNTISANWDILRTREDSPLLNRALQGLYPPGSTIKPMIVDIALENEATNENELFECDGALEVGGGHTIKESHEEVHGKLHLNQALVRSCNVTFGTLAMRLGQTKLSKGFERFGFDKPLENELNEVSSRMPEFSSLEQGDIAQIGIGQSTLLVTPFRMAILAAAMANDGVVMKPYMIQQITSPQGIVLKQGSPEKWFDATVPERAHLIDGWMEEVVVKGTGTEAKVSGVRVTGKTGTAENSGGKDHAWFIGSALIGKRKIVFSVIVENSGGGGEEAAPIARKIVLSLDKS